MTSLEGWGSAIELHPRAAKTNRSDPLPLTAGRPTESRAGIGYDLCRALA